ncbi:MAG: coat protein [Erysiphe necator associated partitivirus 2]|nr:coat protein [Erysiphe necator associated partitivirus 2]UTQ50846.1 MAG: coat protein [Erysiphe necator associated partitivirus 2]
MSDEQSRITSVAPSDSASKAGKKSKPGKAERAARRSAVDSVAGNTASAAKAFTFASASSAPKPQPGKYPVIFQTGAGEPARDKTFSVGHEGVADVLRDMPTRFTFNAKYAEFKAHAELDDQAFSSDLGIASLLRLAQQVVHSHVNMGLPQGDFAPVASTDVQLPSSIAAYISQHGEHSVPALGTRFLYSDYESTVTSLVMAADQIRKQGGVAPIRRSWLPVRPGDKHTKQIIAGRLAEYLDSASLSIASNVLEEGVLSGSVPDAWEIVKPALGPEGAAGRDRFDFLFKSYRDAPHFVTGFTTGSAPDVLAELRLSWSHPSAAHVDWGFNPKEAFTRLSDEWARKSVTYAMFFEMSSSQTGRHSALGSQAQMATVDSRDGVTIVKTHLALSAPEFSLAAAFPSTAVYSGGISRRVVVTTPLSVKQRGTEFVQKDWR